MQANNDQNWAEDGAFWDEAWTDMNRRLDENPPRRKRRAIWWWYAGGFLVLLLVVTPVVVAGVFKGDDGPETRTAPLKAPAPHPAAAPEKEVYAGNTAPAEVVDQAKVANATTVTVQRDPVRMPSSPQEKTAKNGTPKAVVSSGPPLRKETTAASEIAVAPAPAPPEESSEGIKSARNNPVTIRTLARAEFTAFPIPNTLDLPAVVTGKTRRGALYVEAGALATVAPGISGFYAGLGYRIPLGERLSLPLSVRYRRESLPVGEYPESGSAELAIADPDASADTTVTTGSPVFGADRLNFTTLRTEAVELTTGISYAFTPRLRATAGLNVAYMTQAQLFATSIPAANGLNTENSFDLLSGTGEFRNVLDGNFADRGEGAVPDLNPLQFSGHLSVGYDLTRRLSLSAAGTYLLRQPDRAEVIGLPAARVEAGVRWRLF